MDSEFGGSRAVAKNHFILQHHRRLSRREEQIQLDRFNIDDFEVEEEDPLPEFSCPYCYEEFDIASLCSHLEDEHSYESKAIACPVCSVKVAGDVLNHIILQHGHLFKISLYERRRRLRRSSIPNSRALSLLGKDLREAHLQALLGGSGYRSHNTTSSNAVPDPFLSSLLNFSASETEEISKSVISSIDGDFAKSMASQHRWKSSFDSSLSREEREERTRQAAGRAVFIQDMLASTLLVDQ
ncbi:Protein DEHYDRATION-INDUCED [Abeliophyllum distichum]|uniref:Protein DEHYDRATION-INDUCED n=1 Tax=Abeliophyllum distichum TaxID=126358 RepID=A0ABD1PWG6_9LAMI